MFLIAEVIDFKFEKWFYFDILVMAMKIIYQSHQIIYHETYSKVIDDNEIYS